MFKILKLEKVTWGLSFTNFRAIDIKQLLKDFN